jgi:hypothetical protein
MFRRAFAWWLLGITTFAVSAADASWEALRLEMAARTTNQVDHAVLFKPSEEASDTNSLRLAPLFLQEVRNTNQLHLMQITNAFGADPLPGNATQKADGASRVHFLWQYPTLGGLVRTQISYVWFVSPVEADAAASNRVPWNGVRLTLNQRGEPVFWEILAETRGLRLVFSTYSQEFQARLKHGARFPGRNFSLESDPLKHPRVALARLLEDNTTPMGPIIYLTPEAKEVMTLICRCMPSQGKQVAATGYYSLRPMPPEVLAAYPQLQAALDRQDLAEILRLP